jgi:cytochrome c
VLRALFDNTFMRQFITILIFLFLFGSCEVKKDRVLVFSKSTGFRHESIPDGIKAIEKLGQENDFEVDATEDATLFHEDNLKRYSAIVFLNTTEEVLDPVQQSEFKRYIEAGGGFVGIHSAADTEYEWPWYGKLVGAYFKSHPQIQDANVKKTGSFLDNPLQENWKRKDEWYNYKNISESIKVIYSLDESTYQGGENGESHPIAWYQEFEGGRSFYTGMGHTKESFAEPALLDHLLQGIKYAMGDDVKLDYKKVKSKRIPEENRFSKVVLDFNLYEPIEMAILPDNNILFIQRHGEIKYYDQSTQKTEVIAHIPVSTKYKNKEAEAEDGLLGVAIDPSFRQNNWIYFYYSPPGKEEKNILTRYTLKGKQLDTTSVKVLLEIPVQRDECCHTGGSIAFDKNGNLYLSTGDNTSPFADGYSPSDERKGREPWDAQKSSSNTNDLRGKIIRIHPEPDGSYTIPQGNLFPKGEPKTRPEIYVMGTRNPYRISIDEKTNYLYWGEVGPDAGQNDSLRGPRGYDEVNQAKKAGFFGWPYFVGKNYAYARYFHGSNKVGPWWDPNAPINESPNNTGKRELPPVSPPFIWYPYAKSDEFPMVKEGGRNAMAGPVYYSEKYKGVDTAFPDYFDGKLLIYDWMRNWMFHVTMDDQGAIKDIEPFMPNTKFNNIIDMEYGHDGKLYMLEYGTGWFKQNLDARLVRIDYNGGNRTPVVAFTADKLNGALPLTVKFSASGTMDYDKDDLKYEMTVNGEAIKSDDGNFTYMFAKAGVFNPELKVTDSKGATNSMKLQIIAGNEEPVLTAKITKGNQTFFFPNSTLSYTVEVNDRESGSTAKGTIKPEAVKVTFDYIKGFDITPIAQGHQMPPLEAPGKGLMDKSDCKSCHLVSEKSAGPSYLDIAKKYKGKADAVDQLAAKIIKGGAGVWGTIEMSAHPQVPVEDAKKMVEYILALGDQQDRKELPLSGTVKTGKEQDGAYVLAASYQDDGASGLPSLSSSSAVVLRAANLKADQVNETSGGPRQMSYQGFVSLENVKHNSWAMYRQIDLTGVKSAKINAYSHPGATIGGEVEIRLDKPDGKLLAKAKMNDVGPSQIQTKLEGVEGLHDLYFVFKNEKAGDQNLFFFGGALLQNK